MSYTIVPLPQKYKLFFLQMYITMLNKKLISYSKTYSFISNLYIYAKNIHFSKVNGRRRLNHIAVLKYIRFVNYLYKKRNYKNRSL